MVGVSCTDPYDLYSVQLTEGMYVNLEVSDYESGTNNLNMYLNNVDVSSYDFSYTEDSTHDNETINLPSSGTILIQIYPAA